MSLITRTNKKNIDTILEELLKQGEVLQNEQKSIKTSLQDVQLRLEKSYQKVGLKRFNAFGKGDGEQQSFVLAFLDGKNDGVVVNFIYVHDGIRVYSKKVKAGKGEVHELSDEEKEAVIQAV